MWSLAKAFFEITLHERGPADIPASWFLFCLVLTADIVTSLGTLLVSPDGNLASTLMLIALSTSTVLLFIWISLSLAGKPQRFLQTATAFFGIDTILTFLSLPVLWWAQPVAGQEPQLGPTLLLAVVLIWLVDVFGYILSRSLAVPYVVGVLLVVAYEASLYQLSKPLLPEAP